MSYSQKLVDSVDWFLGENLIEHSVDEEGENVRITWTLSGFSGKIRETDWMAVVRDDDVIVHQMLKLHVDEKFRPAVAEYLTRINFHLVLGAFVMDFADGEVRYKMAVTLADIEHDKMLSMQLALQLSIAMVEKYGEGVLSVMFGLKSPQTAAEEALNPESCHEEVVS